MFVADLPNLSLARSLASIEKLDDGTDFKEQMQILLEHLSKIDANVSISQKEIHLLIGKYFNFSTSQSLCVNFGFLL